MGHVKRNVRKIHTEIIHRMRTVSSGPLFSTDLYALKHAFAWRVPNKCESHEKGLNRLAQSEDPVVYPCSSNLRFQGFSLGKQCML